MRRAAGEAAILNLPEYTALLDLYNAAAHFYETGYTGDLWKALDAVDAARKSFS